MNGLEREPRPPCPRPSSRVDLDATVLSVTVVGYGSGVSLEALLAYIMSVVGGVRRLLGFTSLRTRVSATAAAAAATAAVAAPALSSTSSK